MLVGDSSNFVGSVVRIYKLVLITQLEDSKIFEVFNERGERTIVIGLTSKEASPAVTRIG